ncbi:MAG TPA: DNA polymerase III subunit delta [Tepidisphaeraceae bacterium]|nr:DNA polymerase III subunit delta [Tepidisphaeraceae bacterium]
MAKPVYALVGPDLFLQLQAIAGILREMPADVQRLDIEGERAELAEVLDELRSFAMFGGGKLVIVRDADAFISKYREQLEDYLAAPSDSSTLVLRLSTLPSNQRIYKAIAKVGAIEQCVPPKLRDLPAWAIKRAQSQYKLHLAIDAAQLLVDLLGDGMARIDNELAKLAISNEGQKITAEQISMTTAFQREREMWDMTDALGAGRPAEALRRWRQLLALDPSTEFRAVTWLTLWLENVRKALAMQKRGMDIFAICSQLRIWPREAQQPFMRTASALGEGGAARALDLLTTVDLYSKSGLGDAASNVERFILQLADSISIVR